MNDFKKSFSNRRFKMGGYQTLVMVIVIVLVIVLNLVVNKLNISVDLSSDQKYTLTEDSKKLASGVQDSVKMYFMCPEGQEQVVIEKVLQQYNGLGNIEVIQKDPVIYPTFAQQYTEDEIQSNDVIVVNETKNKNKVVKGTEMIVQGMDYTTYSESYTLDAEGQLTSALQSVTAEDTVKMYYTSGHNEAQLNDSLTDILRKSNIDYEEIATSSKDKIPEDCNILMINAPQYDFSEEEYKRISDYLADGGKAMFFLNVQAAEKMTNYEKLLSDYGVNVAEGYVVDVQGAMNANYPTMLVPQIEQHELTADVGNTQVVLPVSKGMTTQSDVRSTLTVTPFLTTTDSAYSKVDLKATSMEKEEGDIQGPFSTGLVIKDAYTENTQGEGKATEIVVFGTGNAAASDFIATNQFGNRSVLLNTLTYLSGTKTSTLAVPTRNLNEESVVIQQGNRIFFTVLLVVIIPLALLAFGFVIWYRRGQS